MGLARPLGGLLGSVPCAVGHGKGKSDRPSACCLLLLLLFRNNICLELPFSGLLHQDPAKSCVGQVNSGRGARIFSALRASPPPALGRAGRPGSGSGDTAARHTPQEARTRGGAGGGALAEGPRPSRGGEAGPAAGGSFQNEDLGASRFLKRV